MLHAPDNLTLTRRAPGYTADVTHTLLERLFAKALESRSDLELSHPAECDKCAEGFELCRGFRGLLRGFYGVLRPRFRRRLLRERVACEACETQNDPGKWNATKCHASSP